jgi:hypothetical protein
MKRDDGTLFVLAAATALAAAAAARRRSAGSPALESMTMLDNRPRGIRVSQPFKGLVGAASGGAAYKRYEKAFANAPFDLRLRLSGQPISKPQSWARGADRYRPWVHDLIREGRTLPYGTIVFGQVLLGVSSRNPARVEQQRISDPVGAASIMSPFTIAHRLFDAVLVSQPVSATLSYHVSDGLRDGGDDGHIRGELWDYLRGSELNDVPVVPYQRSREAIYAQLTEGREDEDEDALHDELDSRIEEGIGEAVDELMDHYDSLQRFLLLDDDIRGLEWDGLLERGEELPFPHFDSDEDGSRLNRLFASLVCPTAAGRKLLLSDVSQAGADCFAMWCLSYNAEKGRGTVPAMSFSAEELQDFNPDAWADKWYQRGKHHKKVTIRKRDAYADALRPYTDFLRSMEERLPGSAERAAEFSREFASRVLPAMKGALAWLKAYKVVVL